MPNSSFQMAFRAMALGFALPATLFVGSEFWPAAWQGTPLVKGSTLGQAQPTALPTSPAAGNIPPGMAARTSGTAVNLAPSASSPRSLEAKTVAGGAAPQVAVARRANLSAGSQLVPDPYELPEEVVRELPEISFRALPIEESPLPPVPRIPVRPAFAPPAVATDPRLEAQLSGLERKIEQIAQAQSDRQQSDLERAKALYDQMRNTQQLQQIENRLNELSLRTTQAAMQPPVSSPSAAQPSIAQPTNAEPFPPTNALPQPPVPPLTTSPAFPPNAGDVGLSGEPTPAANVPQIRLVPQIPQSPGAAPGTAPPEEKFDLQVEQAELPRVLELLAQMAGINILTSPEVVGKVTINLQGVTLENALDGLLRSRGYIFQRDGDIVFVMSQREADARRLATRRVMTKIYQPNYINVKELQQLVQPIVTPTLGKLSITSPAAAGIAENSTDAGGDSLSQRDALLVQDYEEVINEIDRIMIEMDIPPLQVIIDAKILSVKLTEDMAFGVNLALLGGDNNLLVSGNGAAIATSSGFPGGSGSIVPPAAQFLANTAGLKYGFIAGDITGFIRALENIADTSLVASPQIRALNKQRAEMIIGTRLSYKTLAFNSTQTIENVNFLESGTKLIIRPFIAPDGLVRMEVHPERSRAIINQSTGLPDQDTTEVTTNVMVRDGQTVVIGGLISEESTESIDRVPLLGALPLVGAAFRNKTSRIERTELIVLITPRIIDEFAAAAEGEVLQQATEERAAHFRDHLSPVNRNSLTRAHYERAAYYSQKGDLMRARQHIDAALHQNSADLDALQLRNEINAQIEAKTGDLFRWPVRGKKSARQAAAATVSPSPVTPTVLLPNNTTTLTPVPGPGF